MEQKGIARTGNQKGHKPGNWPKKTHGGRGERKWGNGREEFSREVPGGGEMLFTLGQLTSGSREPALGGLSVLPTTRWQVKLF